MKPVTELVVYSRRGCHLCELMLEELAPLVRQRARIIVRDVDERDDWRARYGERVPVLCVGETEVCHYRLDRDALGRWLASAQAHC